MTNIQYHSDLHLESNHKLARSEFPINPAADILVFAGDITNNPQQAFKFFSKLRERFTGPIIYVLGNHEFYGCENIRTRKEEIFSTMYKAGVIVLDKDNEFNEGVYEHKGITFLGATLYSDLSNPVNALTTRNAIDDFDLINGMTIDYWQSEFDLSCTFIDVELFKAKNNRYNNKTVVITHFAPLIEPIMDPAFEENEANAGFYTDLSEMILQYQPKCWIYGHTHYNADFLLGETDITSNQCGYRFERGSLVPRIFTV